MAGYKADEAIAQVAPGATQEFPDLGEIPEALDAFFDPDAETRQLLQDDHNPEIAWGGPALPGAFPDYDANDPADYVFAPAVSIKEQRTSQDVEDVTDDNLHRQYVNYEPQTKTVGKPSLIVSGGLAALAPIPATTPVRIYHKGAGTLLGFNLVLDGVPTNRFMPLTDSLDGNGPTLFVIDTQSPIVVGYVDFGTTGIRFENGLTLSNMSPLPIGTAGNAFSLIPIIAKDIPA